MEEGPSFRPTQPTRVGRGERREPRGKGREAEARALSLERQLRRNIKIIRDLETQAVNQDALLRILRDDREAISQGNKKLVAELGNIKGQTADAREEIVGLGEALREKADLSARQKDQIKHLTTFNKEVKERLERAEAEAEHLRPCEARALTAEAEAEKLRDKVRELKEVLTAAAKTDGLEIAQAYLLGFGDSRTLADLLHPGIAKLVQLPLEEDPQRRYQVGEGSRGAGTSKEPIDLNGDPAP